MPTFRRAPLSLVVCLGLVTAATTLAVGCADKTNELAPRSPAAAPAPSPGASSAPTTKRAVPAGHLRREDVMEALSGGPGAFLAKLDVEPVLDRDNKFRGWRVVEVRDAALGEQLAVGDVIKTVNGRRIEREGEFYEVFMGMAFARELTVATVRAGHERAISLPIDDDPNAPPIPLSPASSAAAAPMKAKKQR